MAAAETGVVENPLAAEDDAESPPNAGDAGAAAAQQRSDDVDIEAGLRDGTLTTEQAFALMERQIEVKVNTKIAQLEARLSGGAGHLQPASPVVHEQAGMLPAFFASLCKCFSSEKR